MLNFMRPTHIMFVDENYILRFDTAILPTTLYLLMQITYVDMFQAQKLSRIIALNYLRIYTDVSHTYLMLIFLKI